MLCSDPQAIKQSPDSTAGPVQKQPPAFALHHLDRWGAVSGAQRPNHFQAVTELLLLGEALAGPQELQLR
jgi:hypothetical protein